MNTPSHTDPSTRPERTTTGMSRTNRVMLALGLGAVGVVATVTALVLGGDDDPSDAAPSVTEQQAEAPDVEPTPTPEPAAAPAPTPAPEPEPETETDETPPEAEREPAAPAPAAPDAGSGTESADAGQAEASEPSDDVVPAPEVVVGTADDGHDIVVVFEISKACGTTYHQPLGDSPSYIRWAFDAPGLGDGTEVSVVLADGTELAGVVDGRRVVVDQGIDSYGTYPFPAVGWTGDDGVDNTITPDGQHVVDDREGEPSETCLQ